MEKRFEDEKQLAHLQDAAAEIAAAKVSGKIVPASEAFYIKTCATPAGLADFREFLKSAPVIAPESAMLSSQPATQLASTLTEQDFKTAQMLGVTREQLIAANKNN
jgi:phage I-like protein